MGRPNGMVIFPLTLLTDCLLFFFFLGVVGCWITEAIPCAKPTMTPYPTKGHLATLATRVPPKHRRGGVHSPLLRTTRHQRRGVSTPLHHLLLLRTSLTPTRRSYQLSLVGFLSRGRHRQHRGGVRLLLVVLFSCGQRQRRKASKYLLSVVVSPCRCPLPPITTESEHLLTLPVIRHP